MKTDLDKIDPHELSEDEDFDEICEKRNALGRARLRQTILELAPQCCQMAASGFLVRPVLPFGEEDEEGPHWRLEPVGYGLGEQIRAPWDWAFKASFCPACGTNLPGFRKKEEPPEPLCVVDESMCYCDTCSQRLQMCICYPFSAAWERDEQPDS